MTSVPPVDWNLAERVGALLVDPGPELSEPELAQVVAGLRIAARRAEEIVARTTGLVAPPGAPALVVDRPTWLSWNVRLASWILAPYVTDRPTLPDRLVGEATAVQVGTVLAWVSGRVLGQYDPYAEVPRLLLVAPTVAAVERSLGVDHDAFRLWICIHEVTHRYQFGQAPWLAGHLRSLVAQVVDAETPSLLGLLRGGRSLSFAEVALGPQGREALAAVTAVMSLVEGYADVMMDRTDEVPLVASLRAKLHGRRTAPGLDAVMRGLMGLDVKHAQYSDGAAFCTAVIDRVGVPGLNRVYERAENLPTSAEIADPGSWVDRVC
ncbi:MAG: zinc-dependent metalloprotease [Propionibacteriaceae bacterium]